MNIVTGSYLFVILTVSFLSLASVILIVKFICNVVHKIKVKNYEGEMKRIKTNLNHSFEIKKAKKLLYCALRITLDISGVSNKTEKINNLFDKKIVHVLNHSINNSSKIRNIDYLEKEINDEIELTSATLLPFPVFMVSIIATMIALFTFIRDGLVSKSNDFISFVVGYSVYFAVLIIVIIIMFNIRKSRLSILYHERSLVEFIKKNEL
jgi:hypothetical protein